MNYTEGTKRIALVIYLIWSIILLSTMWLLSYSYPLGYIGVFSLIGLAGLLIPIKDKKDGTYNSMFSVIFSEGGAIVGCFLTLSYLITATFVYPWGQMHMAPDASTPLLLVVGFAPALSMIVAWCIGKITSSSIKFIASGFHKE